MFTTSAALLGLPGQLNHSHGHRQLSYSGSTVTSASLDTLLGRAPSPGWALLGLEGFTVNSKYDADWFSHCDPYARVTLNPGGLRYFSTVLRDANSGDFKMHFYVPLSATSASVEIHDEDMLHREGSAQDDLVGSLTVRLPGASGPTCSPGTSGSCTFTSSAITQDYVRSGWWWEWKDVTAGSISGYVATGAAANQRAELLNAAGVEMTEAWTPVLDPRSAGSYFAHLEYNAQQLRYLITGMLTDEPGKPVSGIWNNVESRAYDGKRLATGPGTDTTSVIGNAYARESMENLASELESNDRFRRNELGIQFFNGIMWDEKPNHAIALGDNAIDHARIRPILDKIVGPAMA